MALFCGNSHAGEVEFQTDSGAANPYLPTGLVWEAVPGVRYDLLESSDLSLWTRVDGYPKEASAEAIRQSLASLTGQFFNIITLDEQPPELTLRFPDDGMAGIDPDASIYIELDDPSGIDPASIQLTLGALDPLGATSTGVTVTGNIITFEPVTTLGAPGETLTATLVVQDTHGNGETFTWTFRLAPEPMVEENIFVFGSSEAIAMGQDLSAAATSAFAFASRPEQVLTPSVTGTPWRISSVATDHILIEYDTLPAPEFAAGALLCNDAPATADEVFYRRLVSTSDDTGAKVLTLNTADASLEDFIIQGGTSVGANTTLVSFDEMGAVASVASVVDGAHPFRFPLPSLGPHENQVNIVSSGGFSLDLTQLRWQLFSELTGVIEFEGHKLTYYDVNYTGEIKTLLEAHLNWSGSSTIPQTSIDIFDKLNTRTPRLRLLKMYIYGVPVWLELAFHLDLNYEASASAEAGFTGKFSHDYPINFSVTWKEGDEEASWQNFAQNQAATDIDFQYQIDGTANAKVSLVPRIALEINRLVNINVNIDPTLVFTGEAGFSEDMAPTATWTVTRKADLNLGVGITGLPEKNFLVANLLNHPETYILPKPALTIVRQPTDYYSNVFGNVATNGKRNFLVRVEAVGPEEDGPITYQWYHWGVPIPGKTESSYYIRRAGGPYYVIARQGTRSRKSETINFFYVPDN